MTDVTDSSHKSFNRPTLLVALALAAVTFLVYLPTRHFDFLNWDDQSYITENDHVRGGVTRSGFVWALTRSHSANWHPLTWLSHALDCQFYGLHPEGHHLTNVALHALNTVLLFMLLWTLTKARWRSALVAAIFALHPLRVESVAWVSERKDVLSLCFGLLTLLAYAKYAMGAKVPKLETRNSKVPSPTLASKHPAPRPKLWYALSLVLFALGLMSKPMLVTWPFVLLLLDWWPLQRISSPSMLFRRFREKLPFLLLSLASCIVTMWAQQQGGAVASFEHLPLGQRLQNATIAYAEYLIKFFWPANLSPVYPYPTHISVWSVVGSLSILGVISLAAWRCRARFPYVLTGWLWFVGTLVPVIGIVQVGSQPYADRYTYIPLIGLSLMTIWLVAELNRQRQLLKIASGFVSVVVLIAFVWCTANQLSVWKNTETLFERTLSLFPDTPQALNGLGAYYLKDGRISEGKKLLERLLQLSPDFVEARGTLADALDSEGRYAEAAAEYTAALALRPKNVSLLNNLAWLRAACPDPAIRDGAEGVRLASRACELTHYSKPVFVGTLAAAQAEAGEFKLAIATAEAAATLAKQLQLEEVVARNHDLIQLYQQGKAAYGTSPQEQHSAR